MANQRHTMSDRMYMSKESLANALDCSKSMIDDLVRRKVIPEPVKAGSLLRWRWDDVDTALRVSAINERMPPNDGVRNARTGGPLETAKARP